MAASLPEDKNGLAGEIGINPDARCSDRKKTSRKEKTGTFRRRILSRAKEKR